MHNIKNQELETSEDSLFTQKGTYIHPTAVVSEKAQLGTNVKIGPYALIFGATTIGDNSRICGHTSIGSPAQIHGVEHPQGTVSIGSNVTIKEFVTINAASSDHHATTIGAHCYLMHFAHVAHDVTLENNVTLTNHAQIAGHAHLEHHVLLMANSGVHQHCRIGAYSALAPFSGCRQDIPPYGLYTNMPAAYSGLNSIGLRRAGFTSEQISALKKVARLFYLQKLPFEQLCLSLAQEEWAQTTVVQNFISFIAQSKRGVSRATLKDQ